MSLPLFLALMALCCGYALARGGAPERVAAALQIGAFAVTFVLYRAFDAAGYRSANTASAAVDVVLLLALIALACRSTRFWPMWIAGWQLAVIVAHLAKSIDPAMLPPGYAIQAQIWAYPMLIATAVGAWRHQRRLQAGLNDPAWKLPAD